MQGLSVSGLGIHQMDKSLEACFPIYKLSKETQRGLSSGWGEISEPRDTLPLRGLGAEKHHFFHYSRQLVRAPAMLATLLWEQRADRPEITPTHQPSPAPCT